MNLSIDIKYILSVLFLYITILSYVIEICFISLKFLFLWFQNVKHAQLYVSSSSIILYSFQFSTI